VHTRKTQSQYITSNDDKGDRALNEEEKKRACFLLCFFCFVYLFLFFLSLSVSLSLSALSSSLRLTMGATVALALLFLCCGAYAVADDGPTVETKDGNLVWTVPSGKTVRFPLLFFSLKSSRRYVYRTWKRAAAQYRSL
jgi:hypothetical protein